MLLAEKTVEELIVEGLKKGPSKTVDLIKQIRKERSATTKQGVYRVLRILKTKEVVVIHKKQVSLNIRWLKKIQEFSELASYYYQKNFGLGYFARLKNGERIKYTFNNLSLTDAFWDHVIYILLEITPLEKNWLAYNPHCWFFIVRQEEEKALMKGINRDRKYLLSSGHKTAMDKIITKEFDSEKSQYCLLEKTVWPDNYYFNVIGDFIIEVFLDKSVSQEIGKWYRQTKKLTLQSKDELRRIVNLKKKTILIISHNIKKAAKLRNKLKKNFY